MHWYFKLIGCITGSLRGLSSFSNGYLTDPTDTHIQRVRFTPSAVQHFGCQFHHQAFPPGLTSEGTGWNRVVRHRYPLVGLSLVLDVIVGGALLSPKVTWLRRTVLIERKQIWQLSDIFHIFDYNIITLTFKRPKSISWPDNDTGNIIFYVVRLNRDRMRNIIKHMQMTGCINEWWQCNWTVANLHVLKHNISYVISCAPKKTTALPLELGTLNSFNHSIGSETPMCKDHQWCPWPKRLHRIERLQMTSLQRQDQ